MFDPEPGKAATPTHAVLHGLYWLKEIAQALFVTLRTVEMHLSNAYGKLEIKSRHDLARALSRTPHLAAQPSTRRR